MRLVLLLLLCASPAASGPEGDSDLMECILVLTGASSAEELDENVVSVYEALASRPVCINLWNVSRLRSCGLFSPYQVASIDDYRTTYGDILSVAELALLDGFCEQTARALEPFVSFDTSVPAGMSSRAAPTARSDLSLRASLKLADGVTSPFWRGKYLYTNGDRWEFGLRRESFDLAVYGRRRLGKVVIGDFNARFGQGLALWSGMSLTGFSGASSFVRHPSGISPSHSYTHANSHRGIAADFNFGRFCISTMGYYSGETFLPSGSSLYGAAVNVTHFSSRGQCGLTFLSEGVFSADFRTSAGSVDLFGEAAYDMSSSTPAGLLGLVWNPSYAHSLSLIARAYPDGYRGTYSGAARTSTRASDEWGCAVGYNTPELTLTVDATFRPARDTRRYKGLVKYVWTPLQDLTLTLRATERLSPGEALFFRTDLRADASLALGDYVTTLRINYLLCDSLAWLYYLELGRTYEDKTTLKTFVRATVFRVDKWDDRIYTYERDAPGNYSSLVHYGRGASVSLYSGIKCKSVSGRGLGLYLRMAYIRYFQAQKKPRLDVAFQADVNF